MLASNTHKAKLGNLNFRRFISDKFETGDYAIITPLKKTVTKKQWLSRPLKDLPNSNININFGKIPHSDLINKFPYGKVHTVETKKKLAKYTCSKPTLEQWINYSSRKAQPIYSFDAQAIVTLADLHIDYPNSPINDNEKITPLQFLEAGTGHGSLTLAISKALHPANALAYYAKDPNLRGAILHSIDCNQSHSITGKRTLKGFRRGMYFNNVEFHVNDSPSSWINSDDGKNWLETELINKKLKNDLSDPDESNAFLSGIFLDMPNYHEEMIKLIPFVKTGGFIIAFCPSITQILDAIDLIATKNELLNKSNPPTSLHLEHERTIQLLDGAGGGLKEWDTRRALIRATGKIGYSVRPKVGVRTVAGGFVAIWRKMGKDVNLELERDLMENYEGKPDSIDDEINNDESNELNSDNYFDSLEKKFENPSAIEKANESVQKNSNLENKKLIPNSEEAVNESNLIPGIEESVDESNSIQETTIKPIERNNSKTEISKEEKAAMFVPDLMSTSPEVLQDAELKFEGIQEDEKLLQNNEDVNKDFKVEEANLIPFSVLNTVFHSCHGDPDVHVGYMKNVFIMPTPMPIGMDLENSEKNDPSSMKETLKSSEIPENQINEKIEESINNEGKPKVWTKHTI
ncbi:hypothetical protein C6P40_000805 [Pichia californica]|uniref:tRNA (adenine(58)-N(1))-methyltransferase catalytic subunit TRM61 n=1 Tax=Pichia californica TaxID=460514 RepID=A0A9P6WRF7_9ASCO|nr:hypothetical protein C6P42_000475 [[Candida] californica]KAG0690908.1 hypothetical protein C6P40_000805 [[Candida] californica]